MGLGENLAAALVNQRVADLNSQLVTRRCSAQHRPTKRIILKNVLVSVDGPAEIARESIPNYKMSHMKLGVPAIVDEYIAAQPEAMRPKLEQVRAAISKAVPDAVEGIGYRMPGYKLHRRPMLYFAGFKEHYSLFAASGTFFATL